MQYYIAFSIHGTNNFRVAIKQDLSQDELKMFKVARSRRPDYDPIKDGIKLHWDALNRKDGSPIENKGWVTKRFHQLQRMGWHLVK